MQSLTGGPDVGGPTGGRQALQELGAVTSALSDEAPGARAAPLAHAGATRVIGWESRLADYIEARRRTPFAWGLHDCCTFAAGWVALATGTAPFPELRRHRTAYAATRALVRAGCRDAAAIATLALGPPLARTAFAARGDVVAIDVAPGKPALGICLGADSAFAGAAGLLFLPATAVTRAWRV